MDPKSVVIGEGAGAGYDFSGANSTEEAFRVSGTAEVAERLGVEIRNLNRDDFEEIEIEDAYRMDKVRISKTALESDFIISVPVFKTHIRTFVSLGLKNMKGVIPGEEKRKTHRLGLDMGIADLNSVIRPDFTVIDGLVGIEGWWEYPDDMVPWGILAAGSDAAAVDTVGTCLMGFDPRQIMHLDYFAQKQGLSLDLEDIEVVGESIEGQRKSFKSGFDVFKERYPGVSIILGESACTGCVCELIAAMSYVREAGFGESMDALRIILGDPPEEEITGDKLVLMGKCTKKHAKSGPHVKGCPPREDEMITAICNVCQTDAEKVMICRDDMRRTIWESTEANLQS
jgi:uncharacterized protein (DUF362 family)